MYGGFDTIISYLLFDKLSNKSDSIKVIFSSTLLLLAFLLAIFNALLLMSTAVISTFSRYFANETAIAPLPVHKSNILV